MSSILIGALIFSIWSSILFFGKEIGLSMILFVAPFSCFLIYLLEKSNKEINKKAKLLLIPIILLSITYLIFNNRFFNMLNILVIPGLVILMIIWLLNKKFKFDVGKIEDGLNMVFEPIADLSKTLTKAKDYILGKIKIDIKSEKYKKIKNIAKSMCITLPIAFVIIVLLSEADDTFANIFVTFYESLKYLFKNIDVSSLIFRIIFIILTFIYLICFFEYIVTKYKVKEIDRKEIRVRFDDTLTIKMILGVLNVIYLVFCYIQIKAFINASNVHYSSFAREGFFQLMAVSIINLITMLIAKQQEKRSGKSIYIKTMSLIMVVFTFIILLSSVLRMNLYERAYGYTLLRLLVYCSLFTEAILLIPTILYIIDKKIDLAKTYFVIIITMYIVMNFANFDNIIAKRNVDRYFETGKIDIEYLEYSLDTDAIKQIIRIKENTKAIENEKEIKEEVNMFLNQKNKELKDEKMDFRDFNISKLFFKWGRFSFVNFFKMDLSPNENIFKMGQVFDLDVLQCILSNNMKIIHI